MRVLPKRQAEARRTLISRRGATATPHERPAPAAPAPQPPVAANGHDPHLKAERRMRASGGPEDRALYRCQCGFAFEAAVTTTVGCPHCGTDQAW